MKWQGKQEKAPFPYVSPVGDWAEKKAGSPLKGRVKKKSKRRSR